MVLTTSDRLAQIQIYIYDQYIRENKACIYIYINSFDFVVMTIYI